MHTHWLSAVHSSHVNECRRRSMYVYFMCRGAGYRSSGGRQQPTCVVSRSSASSRGSTGSGSIVDTCAGVMLLMCARICCGVSCAACALHSTQPAVRPCGSRFRGQDLISSTACCQAAIHPATDAECSVNCLLSRTAPRANCPQCTRKNLSLGSTPTHIRVFRGFAAADQLLAVADD
jgi:hypothetical protein